VMGRATPMIGAPGVSQPAGVPRGLHPTKGLSLALGVCPRIRPRNPQVPVAKQLRKRGSRSGFEPFALCAREPALLPEATGTSMSRSRLLLELFDSRPYISATDTPGVALAPVTRGRPFAITARFPPERFKEDGMMLKKVNRSPPDYTARSRQSMQRTTCSFA